MKITWYGHSWFKIETEEGSVVFDPYGDGSVPGYGNLRLDADLVLCSHEHRDHGNRDAVKLSGKETEIVVEKISTFHDEVRGAKRGLNNVHIINAEGMRVAHLGDLGCELETEHVEKLKDIYVLMIPIGGYYTIGTRDALKLIEKIQPRVTIPMHYRDEKHGYDVISTAEDFIAHCFNPVACGSEIIVDASTAPMTALMKPME